MAEALVLHGGPSAQVLQKDAAADRKSGEIVQAGGRAGVVLGLSEESLKSGEPIAIDTGAAVEVQNVEAATTFAEGDTVGWDDTANEAVAAADTAKDFDIGKAILATSAGGDKVKVLLNG